MLIKLILETPANTSKESNQTIITVTGLEDIQICYFERYRNRLETLAKNVNAKEIEVFDKGYKFSGNVVSGKIKMKDF